MNSINNDDYILIPKSTFTNWIDRLNLLEFDLNHKLFVNDDMTEFLNNNIKLHRIMDDGGFSYLLPESLVDEFIQDEENEEFVDSGAFNKKYSTYRMNKHSPYYILPKD